MCPAREALCHKCGKKGHFSKVCKSSRNTPIKSTLTETSSASLSRLAATSNNNATTTVSINGVPLRALVDSGSCESFIDEKLIKRFNFTTKPTSSRVYMAASNLSVNIKAQTLVNLTVQSNDYPNVLLYVLPNLCCDIILGRDFMLQHKKVELIFNDPKPPMSVCGVAAASLPEAQLFINLSPNCKLIATSSRKYNQVDRHFIENKIRNLLKEGVIEASVSPLRAQIFVTCNERHKKRLVVDYSQTINKYTLLDAYPLPNIEGLAQKCLIIVCLVH